VLFVAPLLAALLAWALPFGGGAPVEAGTEVAPAVEVAVDAVQEPDVSAPAFAAGNCTYYSNASHTVIVGQFGDDCCNNRVSWGKKTKFVECGGCFPCVPPPQ
jgi:hypothetical protein